MKKFRTAVEAEVGGNIEKIFQASPDSVEVRLENFPKYVRRQHLKRFLAMYEVFKLVLPVKGSVVECGVFKGFGVMSWAKLSTILEPENLTRRIYAFDTFEGFPRVDAKDANLVTSHEAGAFWSDSYGELQALIAEYDKDRFLGHMDKIHLIKGDLQETLPRFLQEHPHLVVSLLFLDMDLYEPTKLAIEQVLPRMPKGAVIAFDELDNPMWPGETLALVETIGVKNLRLRRLEWDPYISFAVLE
jgi:Macrocin-O-methyltransferase (TylF)